MADDKNSYAYFLKKNPSVQIDQIAIQAAHQRGEAILQTAKNTKQQVYKTEQLIELANKAEQRAIEAEEKAEEAIKTAGLANTIAIVAMFVGGTLSVVSIILTLALNV